MKTKIINKRISSKKSPVKNCGDTYAINKIISASKEKTYSGNIRDLINNI